MSNKYLATSLCVLSSLLMTVPAQAANQHMVVAPDCLINKISNDYTTLAHANALALIQVTDQGIDALVTAKNNQHNLCGGFIDVTADWKNSSDLTHITPGKFLARYANPGVQNLKPNYQIKYKKAVAQLSADLNPEKMWANLATLSSFKDRYADSEDGTKAAYWIKEQISAMAKANNRDDVAIYTIATTGYKQSSVIIKIGNSSTPGVVIGAHMDTTASSFSNKPGADDDGSGSVTVLELARTLLASNMHFKNPIFLIWYAAEEEGLVGSGNVVNEFKRNQIPVKAVLHFDLTGYAHNNESTMWLMDDYVDTKLVNYLSKLIKVYVQRPVKHSECGYACSDHARWTMAGYPAAIPAEAAYEDTNPVIHSGQDTIDKLSLAHMIDYLKLAAAFTVEMAEPLN